MLPNLFVLGAAKCGTTTISDWLSQHSLIYVSKVKEPHYYRSPYGERMSHKDYCDIYSDVSEAAQFSVDASVWYLFYPDVVSDIIKEVPKAKFIICLRNPVEMAISLHAQKKYTGHELVDNFETAWQLSEKRESGLHEGIWGIPHGDPSHMSYQKSCSLGALSSRVVELAGFANVHFILLDDVVSDPEGTWDSLCRFVGVEPELITFSKKNSATKRKSLFLHRIMMLIGSLKKKLGFRGSTGLLSPLFKVNSATEMYRVPDKEFIDGMYDFFSGDLEILSRVTGRDLSAWQGRKEND